MNQNATDSGSPRDSICSKTALAEAFQKNGYQEKARDLRALAALLERKRQIAEPAEPTDVPSTDSPIKPQHP